MGNTSDKTSQKQIYIDYLVRQILNKRESQKQTKASNTVNKPKFRDKKIILSSFLIAAEILKTKICEQSNQNQNLFSSLLLFNNLDLPDGEINREEDDSGELSNFKQIESGTKFIFPSEKKFSKLTLESLFEECGIGEKKPAQNTKITQNKISKKESLEFSHNSPVRQVPTLPNEKTFHDVSLQEYLKIESERLKNDQNYINHKNKLQKEHDIEIEIQTLRNNETSTFRQTSTYKPNHRLNIIKNKHSENSSHLDTSFVNSTNQIWNVNSTRNMGTSVNKFKSINTTSSSFKNIKNQNSGKLSKLNQTEINNKITSKSNIKLTQLNKVSQSINTINKNSSRNNLIKIKSEKSLKITKTYPASLPCSPSKSTNTTSVFKIDLRSPKSQRSNHLLLEATTQRSIKIDIRDLMKEEETDDEMQNEIAAYLNKFKTTSSAYYEKPDINDLIIVKQKVDERGRIVIN